MGQSYFLEDRRILFQRDGRWLHCPRSIERIERFRSLNREWQRWALQCGNTSNPKEASESPRASPLFLWHTLHHPCLPLFLKLLEMGRVKFPTLPPLLRGADQTKGSFPIPPVQSSP
uniref:Uncharacterized protein n=1 Tax=Podarcis muralis TaxID=64176 RepID=A0A670ISV6_PODMU